MDYFSQYYWHASELDAAIIQKQEYFNTGKVTTQFYVVASDMLAFEEQYTAVTLPKKTFFIPTSPTIH